MPLWILICFVAFLDVGMPVLFWQQRIGISGRRFLVYKIRTLRPAVDWNDSDERGGRSPSALGRFLRNTRLDEFPQLLNVLVGDMSLIGPRPLLPRDQPANSTLRLSIRPGITGWAQVHGGASLSAEQKEKLDEVYVRNASLWLDLRIMAMTFRTVVLGDRQPVKTVVGSQA
jgi:lipopolysaccharide/colanic/teichoic acid biosynthesis glycosyltransferase